MWSTVLVLALMASTDPLRLGVAVVMISRPRPVLNLLVFWLGGMTTGVFAALILLVLLRDSTKMIARTVSSATASPVARHIQLGAGVLALLIAVVMATGLVARQSGRVPVQVAEQLSTAQPRLPTAFSLLPTRVKEALECRFLWVAFVAGLGSATNPVEFLAAIAAILASGAAVGTQFAAGVAFTVVVLAVIEIPLVSYLATPAKTEAFMLRLHNAVRSHRPRILTAVIAVSGALLVAVAA
ncbi:GAP family protein [Candidatus Mycobacterium methanotrophicum]|uniref:GAP family protein n=1 Tax=Candidatus Mycobacterium methanotrophicum TaxID=2943498 RepID=A0ABY4QFR9_9MYCO|nr:GAP family protein [Candidatus Mycobacterium methanotrophicum]UQX09334.1 GAP family protein [Candidatus Mycobacterium methanotrophicum]